MTDASYAGGDPFVHPTPEPTPVTFDVERFSKDGVQGWVLLRDGEHYQFWSDKEARKIARKLLFPNH